MKKEQIVVCKKCGESFSKGKFRCPKCHKLNFRSDGLLVVASGTIMAVLISIVGVVSKNINMDANLNNVSSINNVKDESTSGLGDKENGQGENLNKNESFDDAGLANAENDYDFDGASVPAESSKDKKDKNVVKDKQQALNKSKEYLKKMPFSRDGLLKQLKSEGFSEADATYGVDNCGTDWNTQVDKAVKTYLKMMPFSHDGLIKELKRAGFSEAEVNRAVGSCGVDWSAQSDKAVKEYLKIIPFSREGLIKELKYAGFSEAEVVRSVDNSGTDWNAQAVKMAKEYLKVIPFSRDGLIKELKRMSFSEAEATHGVDSCEANWNEQAVRKAKGYLDIDKKVSRNDLIEKIKKDGFSQEQAEYGVSKNGL